MQLSENEISHFEEKGFLLIEKIFSENEIDSMLKELPKVLLEETPRKILEKTGAVRSFFAPEHSSSLFSKVIRYKKIVEVASQLLKDDVYIHQSKLNTKHALLGDWWKWHQDYIFWKEDDGMPEDNVLTAMIFLNPVTEFNGPMLLIPSSHKLGVINTSEAPANVQKNTEQPAYMSALTADLKYSLDINIISELANKNGIVSVKGEAGSVLFFHGNIFHASANNLSPWDRHAFLVTYNSINNKLREIDNPRPSFIANRDYVCVNENLAESLL